MNVSEGNTGEGNTTGIQEMNKEEVTVLFNYYIGKWEDETNDEIERRNKLKKNILTFKKFNNEKNNYEKVQKFKQFILDSSGNGKVLFIEYVQFPENAEDSKKKYSEDEKKKFKNFMENMDSLNHKKYLLLPKKYGYCWAEGTPFGPLTRQIRHGGSNSYDSGRQWQWTNGINIYKYADPLLNIQKIIDRLQIKNEEDNKNNEAYYKNKEHYDKVEAFFKRGEEEAAKKKDMDNFYLFNEELWKTTDWETLHMYIKDRDENGNVVEKISPELDIQSGDQSLQTRKKKIFEYEKDTWYFFPIFVGQPPKFYPSAFKTFNSDPRLWNKQESRFQELPNFETFQDYFFGGSDRNFDSQKIITDCVNILETIHALHEEGIYCLNISSLSTFVKKEPSGGHVISLGSMYHDKDSFDDFTINHSKGEATGINPSNTVMAPMIPGPFKPMESQSPGKWWKGNFWRKGNFRGNRNNHHTSPHYVIKHKFIANYFAWLQVFLLIFVIVYVGSNEAREVDKKLKEMKKEMKSMSEMDIASSFIANIVKNLNANKVVQNIVVKNIVKGLTACLDKKNHSLTEADFYKTHIMPIIISMIKNMERSAEIQTRPQGLINFKLEQNDINSFDLKTCYWNVPVNIDGSEYKIAIPYKEGGWKAGEMYPYTLPGETQVRELTLNQNDINKFVRDKCDGNYVRKNIVGFGLIDIAIPRKPKGWKVGEVFQFTMPDTVSQQRNFDNIGGRKPKKSSRKKKTTRRKKMKSRGKKKTRRKKKSHGKKKTRRKKLRRKKKKTRVKKM